MKDNTVILIAEDDAGHFALVKKHLWRSCVQNEILHFKNGQEILDFFTESSGEQSMVPGTSYVLLLDIRMPKVDGTEVLEMLRTNSDLSMIPVIMLTTTDDPKEINRCYDLGCSFYIVKPSDYNRFMECVDQLGAFLSLEGVNIPTIGAGSKISAE